MKTKEQKLQQEINNLKQQLSHLKNEKNPPLPNNPPHEPSHPRQGELQLTVTYHTDLGENHMYWTKAGLVEVILIDKENPIFLNKELTKKGSLYTITFLAEDAGEYKNQSHVYYFSKNNNKFTLKPYQREPEKSRKEIKVRFSGEGLNEKGEFTDYGFISLPKEEIQLFYISKNHPRIKELLNQGKLQAGKHFIIRYGKVDNVYIKNYAYDFNEFNQELEINEV